MSNVERNPKPKVAVVGSLNVDYIVSVERLPAAGETIAAKHFIRQFGGKGANQAVAAARQGASVAMVGCVGDDDDGAACRRRLAVERINGSGISAIHSAPTGVALIAVNRQGENIIVVAAGANGAVTPRIVRAHRARIISARVLLLQFEVPMVAVTEAVRIANLALVPVVLNPSPMREGFPWGKCALDTLIMNSGEAHAIFGSALRTTSDWQRRLSRWRIQRVVITRGSKPTVCLDAAGRIESPTFPVKPVDTVGAGDTFAGTYAARRAEGLDVNTAVRYANCAGALATLKPGAQEAIPSRAATERALRQLRI
jgi:ribokinase